MKQCKRCQQNKDLSEFSIKKRTADGLNQLCKSCCSEINRKWYEEHKQDRCVAIKQWKIKHRDEIAARNRLRYDSDINFRLGSLLRNRLVCAIKNHNKTGSAVRDLGCSIEEFKIYIESKFLPGMTWDNHGQYGWHIDHIQPLASFDLSDPEQCKIACHYTNLQPLWWIDNLQKG